MKARRLDPGELFAGRFVVEAFLGQGSMGSVYRVLDRETGERRALKTMSLDLASAPEFVERFEREASVGARIASDRIVRVFQAGVGGSGPTALPYFTMELLEGEDLQSKLDRGEELDPSATCALLLALFEAMAAAHAANVVHRDLKPENLFVMTTPHGLALKVLDFGVAKVFKETTTVGGTTPGLGTPLWAAPEQAREKQSIRPRSDVWALGLIAYRLLAGKLYWRSATDREASVLDMAMEMLRDPLVPASQRSREIGARDLGPEFDAWFSRCVNRDPAARYPDAGAALAGLAPILNALGPSAPNASPVRRTWLIALVERVKRLLSGTPRGP